MKKVREIAKQAGVSRQAVYRYLKKNKIKPSAFDHHGFKLYSEATAAGIASTLKETTETSKSRTISGQRQKYFELLRSQLKEKDAQIKNLQRELENQQALLSNNQQLLAKNRRQLLEYQDQTKRTAADNAQKLADLKQQNQKQSEQLEKIKNSSWIERLFKKW